MRFEFPTKPAGTLAELWQAILRLLPQLGGATTMIRGVSIGTSETAIVHGLSSAPLAAVPILRANVSVWQTRDPDAKFLYLAASSATSIDVAVLR